MNDEKNFVSGMLVKLPDDNAPDFVKLKLSFKLDEFGPWVAAQKAGDSSLEWINIEIKEGRSGKWYAERDMWKPDASQPARQPARRGPPKGVPAQPVPNDDIPW
jgi:hypothetical protein